MNSPDHVYTKTCLETCNICTAQLRQGGNPHWMTGCRAGVRVREQEHLFLRHVSDSHAFLFLLLPPRCHLIASSVADRSDTAALINGNLCPAGNLECCGNQHLFIRKLFLMFLLIRNATFCKCEFRYF